MSITNLSADHLAAALDMAEDEITALKARLADAVTVLKQVDGCRDGLCDQCQDALDSVLDAARADGTGEG
jgi:hypothetical protein